MSVFKALNVDSDHESEDEVDNTKEIQIEDALKLYQTALKYHSEGPPSFEKAADAYKALFESEIFKYTESLSEHKRHEVYGDALVFNTILEDEYDAGPVQLTGATESAPNTLPQILHLSYKNHGQFMLEMMHHWSQERGIEPQEQSLHIRNALQHFAEALDKEDTDLDLWLRTASVAALLGSQRITRFCLEAVLDGDDELLDSILRLPGLEEGFAGQQLMELVAKLEDNLSLMQAPLSTMRRKKLSETLKRRLNPYPFAPLPSEVAKVESFASVKRTPERVVLKPSKWDWAGVGETILHHFMGEQGGFIEPRAGSCININIPSETSLDVFVELDSTSPAIKSTVGALVDDHASTDIPAKPTATTDAVKENEGGAIDKDNDTKVDEGGSATPQDIAPIQSRKRSTDSAGLPETAEGGRSRSKRIRARDSTTDGIIAVESVEKELAKQLEDKLYIYTHADECLAEIMNDIFERLDIDGFGSSQELRELVTASRLESSACGNIDKAAYDLYAALQSTSAKVAAVLLSGEPVDLGGMSREAGLNAFMGNAKSGISQACVKPILQSERLAQFAHNINKEWYSIKEVAFAWLETLLLPGSFPGRADLDHRSTYMEYRWAEDLKRHLVQIIVNFDDYIYERLLNRVERLNFEVLSRGLSAAHGDEYCEMIETLFELHLDIYSLIKHPHSGVDSVTQTVQRDRLERWSALARDAVQLRSGCDPNIGLDQLALRHIWASVFQMSVTDEIQPEYVIYSMEELKVIFHSVEGQPVIEVQNNAVMPELSVAAVDRELARISMKDFFLKIFDQDEKDPVAIIESLEPILEPVQEAPQMDVTESTQRVDNNALPSAEMKTFLDTATVSLRLSLWQRLREAYEAIEYPPKVVSCYLRSIETLISEFRSTTYKEGSPDDRYVKLLSRLRIIDEVLVKVLQIVKSDKSAFDCLSYEHLQSSMTATAELLRIMSAGNILGDMIRIAQIPLPRFEGCPSGTFVTITARLHDMQLRAWMLQYYLLKEGISQNAAAFPSPSEDQFEFLRHVHYATGVRGFCHLAGRLFLRLAKDEVLRMDDVIDGNNRDTELAQILYDLYGLKTFIQPADCHEFGTTPDILEKKTATQLLPFILSQAAKINIKDIPKTDLKVTIDKAHGALGRPKATEDISLNRKMLASYFKSAVNPISLFNCLKGIGSLSTKYIPSQSAVAASLGWYFLMGNIALNKFRGQKRLTPGSTEDLTYAQAFFLQDLEYSVERWETWYRLAQANDAQLEEWVSWNADKINSNSVELINNQRAAIHCYVMATACAVRDADAAPQTIAKVSDLYTDFGNRIYSSSREPFNMKSFALRESEQKFYSGRETQIVYQSPPFSSLNLYTAWKFASVLFKRATNGKPDGWWNYYMLGKCLWKMYCANADTALLAVQRGEPAQPMNGPTLEEVIEAFVIAIETLPEKRERGREPILEPHYKLVSVVHKLFQRKAIDHDRGADILKNTFYSQNISRPENADDWERFVLAMLKALRAADKSSWHHRMIARAAHVIYDDSSDTMVAYGAKHELTQQMFTKTMAVQVWKPEYERPGRHFVYTSRYTRFFVLLLDQTGDKLNFEALAKRVRRKQTDFFEHSHLWQELCLQYLKLLRRVGRVPEGHEDAIFKSINHDEFSALAGRLEAWCQAPTTQNLVLDVLRDVIELKRLNNGLMKPLLIDDLIGDTYALLYATIGPTLQPLPSEQHQQPQQSMVGGSGGAQPITGAFPISSLTQVQVDGATDAASNPSVPFNIYHSSQHVQSQQPDTTSRPRAKAVGRREIQRRAEACAVKLVVTNSGPAAAPTAIPIRSPKSTHPQVVVPARPSPDKSAQPDSESPVKPNEQLQVPASGTATAAASVTNAESSATASIHDDADDESELSELDESEVREIQEEADVHDPHVEDTVSTKPMFPHLSANRGKE